MVEKKKKLPRIFEYLQREDQFAGGLTCCAGCPLELTLRVVSKIYGKETIIVGTPSCSAPVLHGQNVGAWHKMGYYACCMTGVASSATGLARYYQKEGRDARIVCFTGDGCAADIGFQPMSGAAERNETLIYICYDNEGYMNTGNQRSSTTPVGASTSTTPVGYARRGKESLAKNLPLIMSMHGIPYAATATLSHLDDFARKLIKADEMRKEGFAYLHVFSPCPVGWRIESDLTIQVCRAAVRTNYFPLWEAEHGKFHMTQKIANPKPVTEFTKLMGKFSHLKEQDLADLQRTVNERYALIKSLCDMSEAEAAAPASA
jgi:pyruvate/2-oxoacid:ferredoxin oxidoreductase beta subunit